MGGDPWVALRPGVVDALPKSRRGVGGVVDGWGPLGRPPSWCGGSFVVAPSGKIGEVKSTGRWETQPPLLGLPI